MKSSSKNDILIINGGTSKWLPYTNYYYNIQSDSLTPTEYNNLGFNEDWVILSPNEKYLFRCKFVLTPLMYLNDKKFNLKDPFGKEFDFLFWSWSPDSKKLALSVLIQDSSYINGKIVNPKWRGFEIWIIDIEKFLKTNPAIVYPDQIINLRQLYCFVGAVNNGDAEFTSNSTLALSVMHREDPYPCIWEISTTDNRYLKQLSFPWK